MHETALRIRCQEALLDATEKVRRLVCARVRVHCVALCRIDFRA